MKTVWEYIKTEDQQICIWRAFGTAVCLRVPERIEGCPVTEIGPYAFSASERPKRFAAEPERIRRITVQDGILDSGEMPGEAAAGERLEEVILPDTVSVIGDYAFYGCRRLKRIGFSDTLSRIGSGAFIGCGSLDTFLFRERKTGKNSLSQMLSELRQAVTAEITGTVEGKERRSCLVFPGYYEMSVENVPARIFEVHYQGTGYRYRQCFRDGSVDYKAYDALFGLAKNQEPHQILTRLAYCRIRYPEGLGDEARTEYLDYFSAYAREAGEILLEKDDLEAVRLIAEAGGFDGKTRKKNRLQQDAMEAEARPAADGAGDFYMASLGETGFGIGASGSGKGKKPAEEEPRDALDVMTELAARLGRTECLSYLMDCRYRRQGRKKQNRQFDL